MILDKEEKIHPKLKDHLNNRTVEELKSDLDELNEKIKRTEQKMDVLSSDLSALIRIKKSVKYAIIIKNDEHLDRDIIEIKDDEEARKKIYAYLDNISQCPHCPMRFTGTPSEREKARAKHILDAHPGSKQK